MNRRMLVGLALGLAGVLAMAGAARAQVDREEGMQPGPDSPTMAMAASGGMEPGGPPAEGRGPGMGPRRDGGSEMGPHRDGGSEMGPHRDGGPGMGPRHEGGSGMPMGGPGPREWERLGLSDAQRRKLDDLRDVEQRKVIRLEADLRIAELDLRRLVAGDLPSLQTLGAQVDRIADLRAGILKARLATELGLRGILTPDQRARLRQLGPGPRREAERPAACGDDRRPGGGPQGGHRRDDARRLDSRPGNDEQSPAGRPVGRVPSGPRDDRDRDRMGPGGPPEGPGAAGDEDLMPPDEAPAAMGPEGR
jgi:Spy/CpxP family protein refolding chaperone